MSGTADMHYGLYTIQGFEQNIKLCEKCGKPDHGTDACGAVYDYPYWDNVAELEGEQCGCPYCYCANRTIAGEICTPCLCGAHVG